MDIKVTNFGPIRQAAVNIKPITVIIGKNNKGKSFLSQLIFSIISSLRGARKREYAFRSFGLQDIVDDLIVEDLYDELDIKEQINQYRKNVINRKQLINHIFASVCALYAGWFRELLKEELEMTFGVNINDLVRLGATKSTITIRLSPSCYFLVTIGKSGSISTPLKFNNDAPIVNCIKDKNLIPSLESVRTKRLFIKQIKIIIQAIRNQITISPEFNYPYYLPAGRGGLIDSWETISSAWTVLAAASIPRGMNMPPLPGTSARFYNILQSLLGRSSGEFPNTCANLRGLLNGDIIIYVDRKAGGKRDIRYVFKLDKHTKSINIIHAGSMIKEIGPLYLIIKEVLSRKDIFIVEEPESHLHPAAQRVFIMEIIVELAEQDVYSLFTTHSDIFLRTLAHSVYGSSLKKNRNRLSIDKLAIYLIKDGPTGSITKNVKISKKGILDSLPSFDEVMEELYDEEMLLSISK